MKKLFLLLLLALFVACQRDDSSAELGRISFNNQEVITRGDNTITTANLANFDVWGHNNEGIVFSGTSVVKQNGAWVSAEEKMWEHSTTYHFHAFAPSGLISDIGDYPNVERTRGLSNFVYTNEGSQDLIYAYAERTQGSLLQINNEPVQLVFDHLLSCVKFTFKNNLTEGNITISDVQITEATKSAELNCVDASVANWTWEEISTGVYDFGSTGVIEQGESVTASNVQFLFPTEESNYNVTFNFTYESETAEAKKAIISDITFEMGKSYKINLIVNDKNVVTEEFKIEFFLTEVKEWGDDIEVDGTIVDSENNKGENNEGNDEEDDETVSENGHEYVDLGLPSGIKWATCNVGATAPEEYGDYFAWAETEVKEYYDWSMYKYCVDDYDNLTKYCTDSEYGKDGFVDDKTVFGIEDDVAAVNWGGAWRMPTKVEQDELRNNCDWTWTTQNGVNGCKVTGPNGNSIFIPAAGYMEDDELYDVNETGSYWSSSLYTNSPECAYSVYFESRRPKGWSYDERYYGYSVRPVCP
ncbi:MAG: fimbrillin family protein [Paludibacteraceae bacterium]|nr:fimbrillin family protein [Paludibacteraceae bacterium]